MSYKKKKVKFFKDDKKRTRVIGNKSSNISSHSVHPSRISATSAHEKRMTERMLKVPITWKIYRDGTDVALVSSDHNMSAVLWDSWNHNYRFYVGTARGNQAAMISIKAASEEEALKKLQTPKMLAELEKTIITQYPYVKEAPDRYKKDALKGDTGIPWALHAVYGTADKAEAKRAKENVASHKQQERIAKAKESQIAKAIATGKKYKFDPANPIGRKVKVEFDIDPDATEPGWASEIRKYNKTITDYWDNIAGAMEEDGAMPIEEFVGFVQEEPSGYFGSSPQHFAIDGVSIKVTDAQTGVVLYDE
jgi:hypothetical protein